jgi:hypothetical protein
MKLLMISAFCLGLLALPGFAADDKMAGEKKADKMGKKKHAKKVKPVKADKMDKK